jgi:hypothetical protein
MLTPTCCMNWSGQAAMFLSSLLLLYYQFCRWIPPDKWNQASGTRQEDWQFRWPDQNDQSYPDIVIGLLLTFFLAAFLRT